MSPRVAFAAAAALLAQAAGASTGLTVLAAPPGSGPVTVLYPTAAQPARQQRGPFSIEAAVGAPPLRGNGRLVVLSHGSGGSPWTQTDLAQALVGAGFTVAMPEHAGDNWHDMSDVGPATWKHRPREMSQAIDAMAADARFAPLLDFQQVGVYGMSAGGLTALTMAGARWSPARLAQHCDAHLAEDFPTCVGLSTEVDGGPLDPVKRTVARWVIHLKLAGDSLPQGWQEPRVRAAVAAVPMAAPIDMASLSQPGIPIGLIRAGQDAWLAPRWHIDAVREACTRCTLLADMPDAGHGSILSPQPPDLPARAARLLDDPPGFDRAAVPRAYAAIVHFFVQNLAP